MNDKIEKILHLAYGNSFSADDIKKLKDAIDFEMDALDAELDEERMNCFAAFLQDHGKTAEEGINRLNNLEDDLELWNYMGTEPDSPEEDHDLE